jgi:Chitobiase/beta-hexosaminidase C-terminal domain/NHL repeat
MSANLPLESFVRRGHCPAGRASAARRYSLSVTAITNPKAMKKTWCVLLLSMLFALGSVAEPALQTLVTNGLSEPYGVTVDSKNNYYITDSVNNRIAEYTNGGVLTNLAGVFGEPGGNDGLGPFAHFNNPEGIVFARGGLVVADSGNHRIRFVALDGTVTTLAGSSAGFQDGSGAAAQFNAPAGLAADSAGNVYIADLLNGRVRKLDLANNVTTLAGGFSRPSAVGVDNATGRIYVADTGTHSIRMIQSDGSVSLYAGSGSSFISGLKDSLVAANALFNAPRGLLWIGGSTGLLVSDTGNHCVRRVYTNTNYNTIAVETYISSTLQAPVGLAIDGYKNIPVTDLAAGALDLIQVTTPQPPVSDPKIGIVVVTTNAFGQFVTQLNPVVNSTFNNDVQVAILGEVGTETFYTLDPGANFPDDPTSRNTPPLYSDGLPQWTNSLVYPSVDGSNVLVRAVGMQDGRRPSSVVSARFQFKAANPIINGKNPANFTLSDDTDNAQLWFTTDGSDPTNGAPAQLYLPYSQLNIVNGTNNVVFKVQAFKDGYTPSYEVVKTFLFSDLETSAIGIPRDFSAGIGSTIVVPVEVRVAGADALRSLQFRVEVTPNDGAPPISTQFRNLPIGTNDFISVPAPSTNAPVSSTYTNGAITGVAIAYLDTVGGLLLQGTATAALLAVPIPPTAQAGQTYSLSILYPSATSDAYQTPVPMSILADRTITVTNITYVVGDNAVATWYNAGDFGNGNLNNNDVNMALKVSLGILNLYPFTDLFDAMDTFPPDSLNTVGGDGEIRYLDWQLILERSLRLSTQNWQRAWSAGGVRLPASATLNGAADLPGQTLVVPPPGAVWVRQASFSATEVENAQPGQTVIVPIYVNVDEGASLSGLQFLAEILPSAGAPALTGPAAFVPAAGFPPGRNVQGVAVNAVAYAWDLGSFAPPLQGHVLLGNVVFTVPATAHAGQSYTLHFGNADGAPDENTQYDFESFPAGVWVNAPAVTPAHLISDEWKLKFFGSLDDPNAAPEADPDNDGCPNWKEYLAGTDPTNADSRLRLSGLQPRWASGKKQVALQWLSAPGKRYVIESTADLGSGQWTTVAAGVLGDGNTKEYIDSDLGQATQYYRVRLQE